MDGIVGSTTLTVQAPAAPALTSIALTPRAPSLQTGSTQQFVATGTYSDGSTKNITSQTVWSSSKTSVATISSGLASAVGAGTATISAGLNGIAGSTTLTVQTPPPQAPVASFTLSQSSGTAPLTVTLTDTSTGSTSRSWNLGDGTSATSAQVVKTYSNPATYQLTLTAVGAGGSDTATKVLTVSAAAPVAKFEGDVVTGNAPLQVAFTDSSTGTISTRSWTFGDGAPADSSQNPSHTYTQPGVYTVSLTVSGPGGADTLTRTSYVRVSSNDELALEAGEILVDHEWQRVDFATEFDDPIVVAKPMSGNVGDPAVIRITGIDRRGFSIRVQEWDYLDGYHAKETVSYIVMERGYHQLPDGAWVEAGRRETNATKAFVQESFSAPFTEVPVVLAVVTSANEGDAVATRLRNISVSRFEVGMREQESNRQQHAPETIDYIAWEPSFGEVNGMRFDVGLMDSGVTQDAKTFVYPAAFAEAPLFLADMQTTAGADTANLRWSNRNEASVDVWVSEEQSKDTELRHVAEAVGFLLLELEPVLEPEPQPDPEPGIQPPPDEPGNGVCSTPCSLWDGAATPKLLSDPDTSAVELGVKFRSDVDGLVTGVRFYKSTGNSGTHVGSLWSSTGQLLAQATFTSESASGWQQVDFATPVAIRAGTVYVASYHTEVGRYSVDEGYFASAYDNGPLHLLADGESGGNGLYRYGAGGFPTETYRSSNYWIDVVFVDE